eukprot:8758791-Pyramimonas_sp.AAC.1
MHGCIPGFRLRLDSGYQPGTLSRHRAIAWHSTAWVPTKWGPLCARCRFLLLAPCLSRHRAMAWHSSAWVPQK